jgi:HrpA-like RNA helicase
VEGAGVLLKILAEGGTLAGVTHVVLDEVHERDRNSDMALIVLRDLLPQRPDLRIILMSATVQTEVFSRYASSRTSQRHTTSKEECEEWNSEQRWHITQRIARSTGHS